MHCNGLFSMHLSVFDPFFTKNKPTGCSKASEGPKRHFIAQLGLFGAIRGPKWGPFGPKIVSNGLHETQANWLVQGQCGPQRAYLWPNEGPLGPTGAPIEGHLVSNYCSMGHLPCIQMCLIHFSLKTSQLGGPRLGRAPNTVLEPSEGLLGWPIKHENGDFSKSVHANCL